LILNFFKYSELRGITKETNTCPTQAKTFEEFLIVVGGAHTMLKIRGGIWGIMFFEMPCINFYFLL
jgi:hypothetical protein